MKLLVLGAAAGGGFPQWNCNCRLCHGHRSGAIRSRARTQSSVAVSVDGVDWALLNASPDILAQIKAQPQLQPARQRRDTGIRSVLLMDAQIDHTTGLLMLRENTAPLPVYCTDPVREDLSGGNPLFGVLSHYCTVDWRRLAPGGSVDDVPGAGGIRFEILPLTSNAPPYSPHRDQPVPGDTVGLLMSDPHSGKRIFYAPGLGEMEAHVWEAMQAADIVLVDGTMWTDNEMIDAGLSGKTARAMGHLPQSGPGGMLEWLQQLPSTTRKILIHINNSNPILDEDGEQRATLDRLGIEVAYDGLLLET